MALQEGSRQLQDHMHTRLLRKAPWKKQGRFPMLRGKRPYLYMMSRSMV